MTTLGIAPHTLTQEGRDLERAGKELFDRVILIDPHKIWVALEYSKDGNFWTQPKIFHDGEDISNIDALIVRGSSYYGGALSVLSKSLYLAGCHVVDPPERFSAGYVSKIKTSIRRYDLGIGSETYYAFYPDGADQMITHIKNSGKLPVVVKPVDGKRSRGRVIVKTATRLRKIAKEFFDTRKSDKLPLYIQPFENIKHEYRVLMVDGEIIAIVEKLKTRITARGSEFVVPDHDISRVEWFCTHNCSQIGIVGIDVADTDRGFIVIEENRAPMWKRVQEVTGIDIPLCVVEKTLAVCEEIMDENNS